MQPNPPFPKKGTLETKSVEALLREVASKALTGCVTLEPDNGPATSNPSGNTADRDTRQTTKLLFQRGRLVEVRGGERHQPIGELLVQNRAVAKRDLVRALKAQQRHPGRPIGQLLEGLGVLGRTELRRALCTQAQMAIGSTRAWDGGRYAFDEAETSDRNDVRLGLNELLTPQRAPTPTTTATADSKRTQTRTPAATRSTRSVSGFGSKTRPKTRAKVTTSPRDVALPTPSPAKLPVPPAPPVVHTDFTARPESKALLQFVDFLRAPELPFISQREIMSHLLDYVVTLAERAFLFEPADDEFRVEMERWPSNRRTTRESAASIARDPDTVLQRVLEYNRAITGTLEATVGNANLVESLGMAVPRWSAAIPLRIGGRIERILYVDARYSLATPPFEHLEIACISAARECELLLETAATMASRNDITNPTEAGKARARKPEARPEQQPRN
jgi:hypothetical protein